MDCSSFCGSFIDSTGKLAQRDNEIGAFSFTFSRENSAQMNSQSMPVEESAFDLDDEYQEDVKMDTE